MLKKTIEDTAHNFNEYELGIIDKFIEKSDYESAYNECETALKIMPDNTDLINKKNNVEAKLPISLMECYTSSTAKDGAAYPISSPYHTVTDLFGNKYSTASDGFVYRKYETWGIVEKHGTSDFYLNGQYSKLSAAAVVVEHAFADDSCAIDIYGDDKLLYSTKVDNKSTPSDLFEVDVTGVKWLVIDAKIKSNLSKYVAIVNPTLYYK